MRKKIIRSLGVFGLAILMTLGMASSAFAAGGSWRSSGGSWWYAYSGGGYARGWASIGGSWYHFNSSGWMQTGWLKTGGQWYYLRGSGAMAEGWIKSGGAWYWLNPGSGAMRTGWLSTDGAWYYLRSSGAMAEGWVKTGGKWYYLNPGSGAMLTGWLNRSGSWYYLNSSGAMVEGWATIGGYRFYFQPGSGVMLTGWQRIGGDWYYFNSSGAMQVNTWVGDFFVGLSGAMLRNQWVGLYYVDDSGRKVPGLVQAATHKSHFTYAVGDYIKGGGTDVSQVATGSIDTSGGTFQSLPGDGFEVNSGGFAVNSGYNCGHGVYITGFKGVSGMDVVIPDSIDGVPVVYVNLTSQAISPENMKFKYVNATQATHLRRLTIGGTSGALYCEGLTELRYLGSRHNSELTSFDGSSLSSLQVFDFGTLPSKFSIAKQSLVSFSLLYSATDRVMPYIDLSNASNLQSFSIGRTGGNMTTLGPLTSSGYSLEGCTSLTSVALPFQNITTFDPYQFPNLKQLFLANDPLTPAAQYNCQLWAEETPNSELSL